MLPFAQLEAAIGTKELQDSVSRYGRFICPDEKLGAASGAEYRNLFNAIRAVQLAQDVIAAIFPDPESLSHSQRCSPVVQTDDHERRLQDEYLRRKLQSRKSTRDTKFADRFQYRNPLRSKDFSGEDQGFLPSGFSALRNITRGVEFFGAICHTVMGLEADADHYR